MVDVCCCQVVGVSLVGNDGAVCLASLRNFLRDERSGAGRWLSGGVWCVGVVV